MKNQFPKKYSDIISLENLFIAWQEFVCGKRGKRDIQEFSLSLADSIVQLHADLATYTYKHGGYLAFNISDPKPRNIHKASVRDRVLHHAIYRQLYPFFDKTFISDLFSCRLDKGAHRALNRFRSFGLKVSKNHTRTAWVLKMDIKKFFASIDHEVLLDILSSYMPDRRILGLLKAVIQSFSTDIGQSYNDRAIIVQKIKGLPLGNLTSQLFCNVYLNEFDQFAKHKLKVKYYIRYADDFSLLSDDKQRLLGQVNQISEYLERRLRLSLHPDKVYIKSLAAGVDFLGWVHFPYYRVLRRTTRRRMLRRICEYPTNESLQSYLGLLGHGNTFQLKQQLLNWYGFAFVPFVK